MNKNTKLSYLLLCSMLVSSNLSKSIDAVTWAKLIATSSALTIGYQADQRNKEYTRQQKKPDCKLAAWKVATGSVLLTCVELFAHTDETKKIDAVRNILGKTAIFSGSLALFVSDDVGHAISKFPMLGGFFSSPIDPIDNKEHKHSGAVFRFLIPYIALRTIGVKNGWLNNSIL